MFYLFKMPKRGTFEHFLTSSEACSRCEVRSTQILIVPYRTAILGCKHVGSHLARQFAMVSTLHA